MDRRHFLLLAVLVLAGSYLVAGGIVDPAPEPEPVERDRLVQPAENGSYIWPYTSRERSIDERTLAINLIIHGPDERVQQLLVDQEDLEWEELDPETEDEPEAYEDEEGPIRWDDAHGSTRYTFIDTRPQGNESYWITESYQLHTGTYLGSRHHIRAYTTEHDDWTAIQVHQEYFDWFRLRHTVTDIQDSRNTLEAEFLEEFYVQEVRREYHGTHRGWNDGWISVVELSTVGSILAGSVLGLLGLAAGETTRAAARRTHQLLEWLYLNIRGFILAVALAGLILGVRSAGLAIEALLPITPQATVIVLYPVLVIGLPATAIVLTHSLDAASRFVRVQRVVNWIGRPLTPHSAFTFTILGLGAGFILDFIGIGITTLPIQLLLHRLGLMIALGVVAAGSARSDTMGLVLFGIGLGGWGVGLVMPLVGYL